MITLFIRDSESTFHKCATGNPKTYADAVHLGQRLAGTGNFYIETSYVPSREEQLLLPVPKVKSYRARVNAHIARELNL